MVRATGGGARSFGENSAARTGETDAFGARVATAGNERLPPSEGLGPPLPPEPPPPVANTKLSAVLSKLAVSVTSCAGAVPTLRMAYV